MIGTSTVRKSDNLSNENRQSVLKLPFSNVFCDTVQWHPMQKPIMAFTADPHVHPLGKVALTEESCGNQHTSENHISAADAIGHPSHQELTEAI
jgi:hypothetical protein